MDNTAVTFQHVKSNPTILDHLKGFDEVSLVCSNCGSVCRQNKKEIKQAILRGYSGMFCTPGCAAKYKGIGHYIDTSCKKCGSMLHVPNKDARKSKSGNNFCSRSCSASYNNLRRVISNSRSSRSLAEDYTIKLITNSFPHLKVVASARLPVTGLLELDIWIPELELAIELNGPMHYFPIHGDAKLTKIQNNDLIKQQALTSANIRLIVVDISMLKSATVTTAFLDRYFESTVKPVVTSLIATAEGKGIEPSDPC